MPARTTPPLTPSLLPPVSPNTIRPTLNWSLRPLIVVLSALRTFSYFLPPPTESVDDQLALVSRMMSTFGRSDEMLGLIEKMSMSSAEVWAGRPMSPAKARLEAMSRLRLGRGIMICPLLGSVHAHGI